MNKFITIALVLFASIVMGHCNVGPYGAGPAIQQVSLGSLPRSANIEAILNGAASASSAAAADSAAPAPVAPASYAPVRVSVVPAAPAYAPRPAPAYAPHAPAYAPRAPKYSIQPAIASELHPGQHNYRVHQSPPVYSSASLPIIPSEPVAKLYVPDNHGYGHGHGHGAPSHYGAPAHVGPAY